MGRADARHAPGAGRPATRGRAERAQRDGAATGAGTATGRDSSTPTSAASSSAVGVPLVIRITD